MTPVKPLAQVAVYVIVPVLLQVALMLLKPSASKRKGGLALPVPGTDAELQAGSLALTDPNVIWAVYLKLVKTEYAGASPRDARQLDLFDKND